MRLVIADLEGEPKPKEETVMKSKTLLSVFLSVLVLASMLVRAGHADVVSDWNEKAMKSVIAAK